jgi:hypothetical protein
MKRVGIAVLILSAFAAIWATAAQIYQPVATPASAPKIMKVAASTTSDAQSYINQGKFYLQTHNILAARDQFGLALAADPNNQEANLLYGIVRIFSIVEDGQTLNTAGLDSVREIMELSGLIVQNLNVYGSTITSSGQGPASTTPRSGDIINFLKTKALPEVDGAIANLAMVTDPTLASVIAPAAIAQSSGGNISIDYADAMVVRSLLYALKCNLDLLMVYGLDVSIPDINAKPEQLLTYKAFFQDSSFLTPIDPSKLSDARSALVNFIDTYTNLAAPLLLGRKGGVHHLFVLDVPVNQETNEPVNANSSDLNKFTNALADVKASLSGSHLLSFLDSGETRNKTVDLSKFFNAAAPINIRSALSNCSSGTVFPDPTLNGLFPLGLDGYQEFVAKSGSYLLGVTCTGRETPKMEIDPTYIYLYDYSGYSVGPQGITINNFGTATLHTSSVTLGGTNAADFNLSPGTCGSFAPVLVAGASCSVTVDLKRPVLSTGSRFATLQVASDDLNNPTSTVQINGYLNGSTGGSISGMVRDAKTGAGIDWAQVTLYDSQTNLFVNSTHTNSTGGYTFNALGNGSYKVYFNPVSQNNNNVTQVIYQGNWYNGKANQTSADAVVLNASNANLAGIDSALSPPAVTLSWGTVWHRTQADGSQYDALDVGLNTSATTLAGLTVKVDGPQGFSYTFTEADKIPYLAGKFSLFKQYPASTPLAAGVYTFTLTDANGNVSYRLGTRGSAPKSLPSVDSATIQYQRKADGSYRFSWAPVNDTQTYYYRLRIVSHDAVGAPVVLGSRNMASYIDVPQVAGSAKALVDGTAYRVRVEVTDAPTIDLTTSRSDSAFVDFTPQGSDFSASRLLVNFGILNNRTDSNGTLSTEVDLSVNTPTAVGSVDLRDGNGKVIYTFQTGDRSNLEFYRKFTPALAPGAYSIHFTANGNEQVVYATLTAPVAYPFPDTSAMQVEDQGNGFLRFSWANVDHNGAIYYRAVVYDKIAGPIVNGPTYTSARQNVTYVDIPKSSLGDLSTKEWRVEVWDSNLVSTVRNRLNSAYLDLIPTPYNAQRPVINSWRVRSMTSPAAVTRSQVLVSASSPQGVLSEIGVTGPNGYSRNLLKDGRYSNLYGAYALEESGLPAAGLYTITAKDASGNGAVRYMYHPATHAVPPVDFRSFHTNLEPNGDTRISWAPVLSDVPLWYTVGYYNAADSNGDLLIDPAYTAQGNVDVNFDGVTDAVSVYPLASVTIPVSTVLPSPSMFRVSTYDAGQYYVNVAGSQALLTNNVNNASQSVMVKNEAAGFNYGSLPDIDGDGYASNIDSNDNNAAVYPFAGGNDALSVSIVSSTPAAGAGAVAATASICATFDKAIDPTTLTGNFTVSNGVTGAIRYQTPSTACLLPTAPLAENTRFTVTIGTGVKDPAGNALAAPFAWSFTTLASPVSTAFPLGGTYYAPQAVSLTSNAAGATIYYTTDGTTPIYPISGSTKVYTVPVPVSGSATLRYFARDAAGVSETFNTQVYTIAAPVAPTGVKVVGASDHTTLIWNAVDGATLYNVYLTGISSPVTAGGSSLKDGFSAGTYWIDSFGFTSGATSVKSFEYAKVGIDTDGVSLSETYNYWDPVAKVWTSTAPAGYTKGNSSLALTPSGWVPGSDNASDYSILFNADGSGTVTWKADQSQQKMTVLMVNLTGMPIGATGINNIPIVAGAPVMPSGSLRYDTIQTQISESYRTNNDYTIPAGVATLAGIPAAFASSPLYLQTNGSQPFQYRVTFTASNTVNILQYNPASSTTINVGTGAWDIRTVSGQQILAVAIPQELRDLYRLGPDPFFAIVNGALTGGDHYPAGQVNYKTSGNYNKTAMDFVVAHLDPNGTKNVTNDPISQTGATQFVHNGLALNTSYSYRVTATNSLGESAPSGEVTASAAAAPTGIPGDCNNDGTVSIAEVQSAINMYLGLKAVAACVDVDNSGTVSISEVQKVINAFLGL